MIQMLCGGSATVLNSQWVSVMFGYGVGWMSAVESFRFGRDVALLFHRRNNPDLRKEADVLAHSHFIMVHRKLPDLERRFLYDTIGASDEDDERAIKQQQDENNSIHHLQQWKQDTHSQRMTLSPFLKELHEIEHAVLVENEEPQEYLMQVATDCGWNIKALQNWNDAGNTTTTTNSNSTGNDTTNLENDDLPNTELLVNTTILVGATCVFLWGAITQNGTLRTYFLSALFAPFGTMLRWHLSRYNGRIHNKHLAWLPIGTFCANMVACILSACMAAASLKISHALALNFVNSFSSGFAGSLSTVSTLVVESVELLRAMPQHAYGYYYSVGSFLVAAVLGVVCYVWAV